MKHLYMCSGGKDSVASLLVARDNGEPIDEVLYAEVMFDDEISGEHPLHRDFVYNVLKPFVENEFKVPFKILKSDRTFVDFYLHRFCKGAHKGERAGFAFAGMCSINRDCKLRALNNYLKTLDDDFISYVGIAINEPERVARLNDKKQSLLVKYGWDTDMCRIYTNMENLYSPIYKIAKRNGCWFCMNAKDEELKYIIDFYPDYFKKLIELEEKYKVFNPKMTRTETPLQIYNRLK